MVKLSITSEWGFIFAHALHQNHIDFKLIASATSSTMTIEVKNRDFKQACEVIEYTRATVLKGV